MEDAQLVTRARRGDRESYAELVRRHELNIRRLSAGMLSDAVEAEDAAQDVFVKAWERLDAFRGDAAFGTWVHRIAVNHCRDLLRARSRRPFFSWEALVETLGGEPSPRRAPADAASAGAEARDELDRILDRLPPTYREALLLRELNGLSYEEIADTLDVSVDAVKARLKRAREAVREAARHFATPPGVQRSEGTS